jgi:hypothetical protein
MTTRSTHDLLDITQDLQIATLNQATSPEGLASGDIDTLGFDSCQIFVGFGDIDEMGSSPVGTAGVTVQIDTAPDDGSGSAGTYAAAADAEIDGQTVNASGQIAAVQTDTDVIRFGYVGSDRFVRVTLLPTGLTNGGPAGVWSVKGHAHITPTS